MQIMKIFILFFMALIIGCTALTSNSNQNITALKPYLSVPQSSAYSLMIGKWYGSQPTKEGGVKKEIMEHSANGTYKVTFRIYDKDGKYNDQTEVGYWGVSGGIYFTIFKGWLKDNMLSPSNPEDPYNDDAYKIIRITKDEVEYVDLNFGETYIVNRVSTDFEFPN